LGQGASARSCSRFRGRSTTTRRSWGRPWPRTKVPGLLFSRAPSPVSEAAADMLQACGLGSSQPPPPRLLTLEWWRSCEDQQPRCQTQQDGDPGGWSDHASTHRLALLDQVSRPRVPRSSVGELPSQFENKRFTEMCCGTEAGSYLRLIDSWITQLKAQGPSRTCNESKEEEEEGGGGAPSARRCIRGPSAGA